MMAEGELCRWPWEGRRREKASYLALNQMVLSRAGGVCALLCFAAELHAAEAAGPNLLSVESHRLKHS